MSTTTFTKNNLCQYCFNQRNPKDKFCSHCGSRVNAPGIPNTSKHPAALAEGTILAGKYLVGKLLGKGGFGMTYLCYDLKNERKVAIKEFMPDTLAYRDPGKSTVSIHSSDKAEQFESYVNKFFEEAKTVSRFNGNPGIISVYEFFYENNTAYFSMEYLEGMDLKTYIEKNGGRLSESVAAYIIDKVLDALTIVHSTGILHRDISPDNIYLCNDGRIKLIDFGAARQVIGEASKSLSVILKPGFAPMEQYQKKGNQGPWTDIYALGATLYYTITGTMLDDAISRSDDDTSDFSKISANLASIISKMVALKIEDRFQSALDIKSAFNAFNIAMEAPFEPVQTGDSDINTPHPPYPPTPKKPKKKLWIILAVAGAIILFGIIGSIGEEDNTPNIPVSNDTVGTDVNPDNNGDDLPSNPGFGTITIPEEKTNVVASGYCGNNVEWALTDDGVLTLSGKGEMYDYTYENAAPWDDERNTITKVVVGNSITKIGAYAFYFCQKMTEVVIPDSVTYIGSDAFSNCDSLESVSLGTKGQNGANVKQIGDYAFAYCDNLTEVNLGNNVQFIKNGAFSTCPKLGTLNLGKNIESIGAYAFSDCTALDGWIYIPYKTTVIDMKAFDGSDNIERIILEDRNRIPADWHEKWLGDCPAKVYSPDGERVTEDWKVTVTAVNSDANDETTNLQYISKYSPVYFHFTLTGGREGAETLVHIEAFWPTGETQTSTIDWATYDGSSGSVQWEPSIYIAPANGPAGTFTIKFYDDDYNLIGEHSVYITD